MQIKKCSNSTGEAECKTPEEIDKFVSRIQVETWSNFYRADLTIYSKADGKRIDQFLSSNLLDPNHL